LDRLSRDRSDTSDLIKGRRLFVISLLAKAAPSRRPAAGRPATTIVVAALSNYRDRRRDGSG